MTHPTTTVKTGAYLDHRTYASTGRPFVLVRCDDCGEAGIILNSGHHYDPSEPHAQAEADRHNAEHHTCNVALLTEDTRCQLPAGHDGYHRWDPKVDDQASKSLVERLRKVAKWDSERQVAGPSYHALLTEAADEIERLHRSLADAYEASPAIAASVAAGLARGDLTYDNATNTVKAARS